MVGIISGVSQGYKIFINELEKELSSKMRIFRDTKLINKSNGKKKKTPKAKVKAKDDCDMLLKDFMLLSDQLIKTVR